VITILDKKHGLGERVEVRIGKQKNFKSFIFKHPMPIPRKHVLLLEFLLPLPIDR
jgi:hypothetical protein